MPTQLEVVAYYWQFLTLTPTLVHAWWSETVLVPANGAEVKLPAPEAIAVDNMKELLGNYL
jgi:hypothetical protein